MGITNFQPYIKEVYSKAVSDKFNVTYDNLYIDLNFVLHHICYLSDNKNDMLDRFRDYLYGVTNLITPKKRLILAADGPAPLAKMILQRERRLNSIKTFDEDKIDPNKKLNLCLTPGTEFMLGLEKELTGFINYVKEKYTIDVLCFITDSDEGEIKIKRQIQKLQKKYPDDTHVAYSGDSDMILLLFTCDDLSKIYQMINKDTIIHFGTIYDEHIRKFGKTDTTKNDFVLINLLMGNDYIPKVSYLKMSAVWEAYSILVKRKPTGLIECKDSNIKVDPIFFHDLLYISSKKTPTHMIKRFKITDLRCKSYYDYVQGLFWCFGMYISGVCSNRRYIYEHDSSPHILGVMMTVLRHNTYTITTTPSIDIDLYGILLIPEKANFLLSKEQLIIAKKLVEIHPIIYQETRCDICKEYSKTLAKLSKENKLYAIGSDEKLNITKRIGKLSSKLSEHKESHETFTIETIDAITKSFIEIREELREKISLNSESDSESDEATTHNTYIPSQRNVIKKKLF